MPEAESSNAVRATGDLGPFVVVPIDIEARAMPGLGGNFGLKLLPTWAVTLGASFAADITALADSHWVNASVGWRVVLPEPNLFAAAGIGWSTITLAPARSDETRAEGSGADAFAEIGFLGAKGDRLAPFVSLRLDIPFFALKSTRREITDSDPLLYGYVDTHRSGALLVIRAGLAF